MFPPVRRPTCIDPDLASAAVQHLREDSRAGRLAAAQLLARGWALDEEARLAAVSQSDRADASDGPRVPQPHLRVLEGGRSD
ncbi:MAG: hypothetical protein VX265_07640 [Myxococcota bacterium]|nr:hypothetical protein [Myxococcota bacterium]